jgi:hypothetical protein
MYALPAGLFNGYIEYSEYLVTMVAAEEQKHSVIQYYKKAAEEYDREYDTPYFEPFFQIPIVF